MNIQQLFKNMLVNLYFVGEKASGVIETHANLEISIKTERPPAHLVLAPVAHRVRLVVEFDIYDGDDDTFSIKKNEPGGALHFTYPAPELTQKAAADQ